MKKHSFIIDYDTEFSIGLAWLRIQASSKEEALAEFHKLVPDCTAIRCIRQEY